LHDALAGLLADDRGHHVGIDAGQRRLVAAVVTADLEETPEVILALV
jgi:hypothetical protein